MKAILDIIRSRRSVFPNMYTDQPIAKSEIQGALEAARWAPNHKKTEPWRYLVFHSAESRADLAHFLYQRFSDVYTDERYNSRKHEKMRKKPLQAGCVIAIIMHRDPEERIPEWEEVAAIGASVQNMWLYTSAIGIGAYWSSPKIITSGAAKYLNLSKNERCLGLFYMGKWSGMELPAERNPIEAISTWR